MSHMNDYTLKERLLGCNADSLDAYLRGLGFFLLAGCLEPSVRAWWDESQTLNLASCEGVDDLAQRIAKAVSEDGGLITLIGTPWRGRAGKNKSFVDLRNSAEEGELDWFDACALPRLVHSEERSTGRAERSDRENNPLLGQGGGFGRSEMAAAHTKAVKMLTSCGLHTNALAKALAALVRGQPIDDTVSRKLSINKAVLGAYQSGRATGPGLSARDVEPTNQRARTNAWDLVLVIEGLRLFRGIPTRRPEPTGRVQGSFPLVSKARAIATTSERAVDLRKDSHDTFELLAPLWSCPCSARVLRHLVGTARLRTGRGVARDTLDAVLVQASIAAQGLGFDRLVRFAFVPGSDPRYRYAVRRGTVRARGLRAARAALEEIVPFLRRLDRAVREEPPAFVVARRRLEDALAAFGTDRSALATDRAFQARQAQEVLIALAMMELPAARACREEVAAPDLSDRWSDLADDGSPEYRLARALVGGLTAGSTSLLRTVILPQRESQGRWVLDPHASIPDLRRVSDPLGTLVSLVLLAIRRRDRRASITRAGGTPMEDLARLLSGTIGETGRRRLLLLAAALAGIRLGNQTKKPFRNRDPESIGLGAETARLLLAAQQEENEDPEELAWLERAERLASLLLSRRCDAARVAADRELRRRGLSLLSPPPLGAPLPSHPSCLALAVLVPLDPDQRKRVARVVSITPTPALGEEVDDDSRRGSGETCRVPVPRFRG